MPWIKKGLIYKPEGNLAHSRTHAQAPFVFDTGSAIRIYFSSRDEKVQTRPTFIEVDPDDFSKVKYIHHEAVMDVGLPGENDETGVMPSWFVKRPDGEIWLYYTGWNKVPHTYRLSIGLAVSKDGGLTFEKKYRGPVLDRNIYDPVWAAMPSVMVEEDGTWRMWYISCQKWGTVHGIPEPYYRCHSAVSSDGIRWEVSDVPAIDFDEFLDAVGRPSVVKEEGIYKMYYSYRNALDYRTNPAYSYRLGYAESPDGTNWTRKDDLVGIARSENPGDFDFQMMNYAHYFSRGDKKYLFYNGNGFGASGFGYAVWEE
ncbi:hypothetical protein GCM10023091_09100 [Ravibacter arvi]|uniref:Glycosyl hydrolase family 32 N-terminal domain-containing protein n=1 Tax=Ravibacter arvi TaxID=2051041 RepID=A0ABP8LS49_9BACT